MQMKKRALALGLSLILCMSLLPAAAFATEGESGNVTISNLTVTNGTNDNNNESYRMTVSGNTLLSACVFNLTTSEAVTFTKNTNPAAGSFYVSNASVADNGTRTVSMNFNLTVPDPNHPEGDGVNLNGADYALTMTSTDGTSWTGSFANGLLTVDGLAAMLPNGQATVAPTIENGTVDSRVLVANRDIGNTTFILCAPGATLYSVTYMVGGAAQYVWQIPAGMTLKLPNLPAGYEAWCTDSSFSTTQADNVAVNGNLTLYAKPSTASTGNVLNDLTSHKNVVIKNKADWDVFAANANLAIKGQLVTLENSIDCENATYDPLDFKGNFNGGNKTISNATFRSVASAYNSSSEADIYCSGVFAAIGPGQIIANLKLDNITAQNSQTYSGILAGLVDGSGSDRALIQNIQVSNSRASGRTAAGVTGFLRNADLKFCSSKTTTITGIANGGGIVGINNAYVSDCYSTTSPTALTIMGGKKGGVVSKNVRGGRANQCWSTMQVVGDASDNGGTSTNILDSVKATTSVSAFEEKGFGLPNWDVKRGTGTTFTSAVEYSFSSAS